MTETVHGIEYSHPQVILLQDTGIGTSEYAARTCYDSFDQSENDWIKDLNKEITRGDSLEWSKPYLGFNQIEHSDLLDKLAWTHFHYSILEHANLTYLIKGTSRGVLQEHARHRIQGISVRSTRYTMQDVLHAFNASYDFGANNAKWHFKTLIHKLELFVVKRTAEGMELDALYDKLCHQRARLGDNEFITLTMSKAAKEVYKNNDIKRHPKHLLADLQKCPSKRNVGDAFKWIVTDNWKVDMVVTFNLRSLKNYFQLRDSGAAYFQIQWLAKAMKEVTPAKYLNLIIKGNNV